MIALSSPEVEKGRVGGKKGYQRQKERGRGVKGE